MRKIAANYIFPITSEPIRNGYLVINENGTIVEVVGSQDNIREIAGLEYYSGVLVPGMILTVGGSNVVINLSKIEVDLTPEQRKWARYLYSRGVQTIASKAVLNKLAQTQTLIDYLLKLSQAGVSFEDSLKELTFNNAKIFNLEKELGSLEGGNTPGVLLITGFDFENNNLGLNASVKRLV